jgi:hypothetical protein
MADPWKVALGTFLATLFLDVLELAFARILSFVRTLRFLLYFILHLIISGLACYFLRSAINEWPLLVLAGTFLGVGVLSNSDIKIAGANLIPLATLFKDIKAKMVEQAAEEKAAEIIRREEFALLTSRLRALPTGLLEGYCLDALLGAGWDANKSHKAREKLKSRDDYNWALSKLMLDNNFAFAKSQISKWEEISKVSDAPKPSDQ